MSIKMLFVTPLALMHREKQFYISTSILFIKSDDVKLSWIKSFQIRLENFNLT